MTERGAMEGFAAATAVRRTAGGEADGSGPVVYAADVLEGWDIGGNVNGGYMLAIAGRAMADWAGRPPLTVTAHYLKPVHPGPCEVVVTPTRKGRRMATATATVLMNGVPMIQLLGTFGEQQPGGAEHTNESPVELPPWDECGRRPITAEVPNFARAVDVRLHPDDTRYLDGQPSGDATMRGWFSFHDDSVVDAIGLLLVADAFAPPVFNTGLPVAWVPTVELTVHVRGVPAPGPLRCSFRTRWIHDGLLDEDGAIWDSAGELVALARQLALVPRPM